MTNYTESRTREQLKEIFVKDSIAINSLKGIIAKLEKEEKETGKLNEHKRAKLLHVRKSLIRKINNIHEYVDFLSDESVQAEFYLLDIKEGK